MLNTGTTSSAASRPFWPANGLGAVFDFAVASHRRAVGVMVLLSALLFLPGFFQIPPVDRDEAYFAQATKQMIETGDYVDIRYQDDVRYRKCANRHLAVPHSIASWRDRRGADDLLVCASFRRPAGRAARGGDAGGLGVTWC
jgi:hypothetical protein